MKRYQRHVEISPMYRKLVFIGLLLCLSTFANGQRWPFELWHEGRVILLQGDTLKGMIKYDLQQDLVQFTRNDKTVEAFTARKVLFFEIFDNTVHKYRQFYALPYTTTGSYQVPIFFELLEDGKLTLLAREALEQKTYSAGFYGGSYTRLELVNSFYFLDEKGEITQFSGSRNDLLEIMGKKAENVERYIRENRLKHNEKYDFAKIIAYYNTLSGS